MFDRYGLVHPFARPIVLRSKVDATLPDRHANASDLGGKVGTRPIETGWILFSKFEPDAIWKPAFLTHGQAVLEMVPQTIPINANPEFAINVLKKVTANAIIAKSPRSDAAEFAEIISELLTTQELG